jgi:hypothetical protein
MKLVNMARDDDAYAEPSGSTKYGYGLMIRLDDEQCEALGITEPLRAGTKVSMQAVGIVLSVTESVEDDAEEAGESSSSDVCLSIQITDLGLQTQGTASNAANLLFGD